MSNVQYKVELVTIERDSKAMPRVKVDGVASSVNHSKVYPIMVLVKKWRPSSLLTLKLCLTSEATSEDNPKYVAMMSWFV